MNVEERYHYWCTDSYFDEKTKLELLSIRDNVTEIAERFCQDLTFGTGGLRGIIGAGTNRMNIYTIRKATQGLANYICRQNGNKRGVAIAYDSRHMSAEFADETALCLAGNGIKAYVFESLRPTPVLSFAVRKLGCIAGVVITASHNPAEYNGYKVYWEDGAQIVFPKDKEIITEVNNITKYSMVQSIDKEKAIEAGMYKLIGDKLDKEYIDTLKKMVLSPSIISNMARNVKIVYTPLHGTGNIPVKRILNELGFSNLFVVPEQELPDSKFTTVKSPNPEDPRAFAMALELAEKVDADVVLATDPDADRLGVYVKDGISGSYISLNGNMTGVIIADYILEKRKENHSLQANAAIVKTIVTSNMIDAMLKDYNVSLIEVLTGFKYIGEQIKLFEENQSYDYIFGMEESYGCLIGTYARDKDAVAAVMILCEIAAYLKSKDLTLWDKMLQLYERYGYYKEDLESITLKGINGGKKIQEIMERLRNNPPEKLSGLKVVSVRDYENSTILDVKNGCIRSTGLPTSNVLYYELENDSWCCARPSGTEPKIKFYMGVKGNQLEDSKEKIENLKEGLLKLIE